VAIHVRVAIVAFALCL